MARMKVTSVVLLLGATGTLAGNIGTCIENTGGTCATDSCLAWRGPQRCDGQRCFCTNGTCAGSDQTCLDPGQKPYVRVGDQEYKLRNARWPNENIFVQSDGQVMTVMTSSSDSSTDAYRWLLYQLPAADAQANPQFLLLSVKYGVGDRAAAIMVAKTESGRGRATTVACKYVTGTFRNGNVDYAVTELAMNLWTSPVASPVENQTLVMFSTALYPSEYLYVPSTAIGIAGTPVRVWPQDPGAGGYWYFEPPLPASLVNSLRPFSGTRCAWQCGTVSSAAPGPPTLSQLSCILLALASMTFAATSRTLA